jgi:O-antigen ligase
MPLHFLPWVSWHSEVLVFASLLIFFGVVLASRAKPESAPLVFPMAGWPLLALIAAVTVQAGLGMIQFAADAFVLVFYLMTAVCALIIGRTLAGRVTAGGGSDGEGLIHQMAWLMVLAGVASAMLAFVQVTDVWVSEGWVNRMPSRRPGANLGQPNQLATLLLFSLASLVLLSESHRIGRVTAALIAAIVLVALSMTESRTGMLGLAVLAAWNMVVRSRIKMRLPVWVLAIWALFFVGAMKLWPMCLHFLLEGRWDIAASTSINTSGGTRWLVWQQLWQAVLQRPWFGWGLREISTAHNAVVVPGADVEPFTYAHNIILDLAVGGGLPFTLLLVVAVAVWLWRRTKAVNNMGDWYCLAIALPFGLHSLLELPFAYAYFLVPVMLLVGVLEARLAATWVFSLRRWIAGCAWVVLAVAFVWSVREYIAIEEDFRVARFEAARIGHTPSEYQRPPIMLLTQLSAALEVVRIVPRPDMASETIERMRRVALRFPWPATQSRYALVLVLNGNPDEAIRQLKVIRAQHGALMYKEVKRKWLELAESTYPQLGQIALP